MITAVNEFLDDLRGGRMTEAPIVRVEQGELQGRVATSPSGKAYYSFQGIPYAKAPFGSLRFKAPQPPESWEGVRDASSEGNVAAQIDPTTKEYVGDENCLFLNVFTNNLDGEFLPVMLFIHGGGFRFGSGNSSFFGSDYLVEKDVVIVTINYRCGALGFLSLNTPEVPGNAGLKDMAQAVKWVKDNIHKFGGNPGNLTLFGESCGGVATSLLTASPLTKNLINKAIIQSGTGLNSWAFQKNPIDNAKKLANNLGCESDDLDEVLEFLTTTPVKDIVEATEKMHTPEVFYDKGANIFAAVVEKEFPNTDAFLTEAFIDVLTSGRTSEVPIMIGTTSLEFTFERTTDDLQNFIPEDLHIAKNTPESVQIADKIKDLYFKGNHTAVESLNEYFQLLSDKLVNIDTHRYVKYLVKVSKKPVYYYKFDYVGELNITKKLLSSLGLKHAGHMDELGYLFKNDLQNDVEPTADDLNMRETMLLLWTNFAKTGNPTPEENKYITVGWLPVNENNIYYLNLGNELSLSTNPDKEKMEFWDDLYSKYYRIWEQTNVTKIVEVVESHPGQEPDAVIIATLVEGVNDVQVDDVIVVEKVDDVIVVETAEDRLVIPTTDEPVTTEDIEKLVDVVDEPVVVEPVVVEQPIVDTDVKSLIQSHEKPKVVENGNGVERKVRPSNEIKMVVNNGMAKDVIRANDPPEDDLPKNIGVNKFVNFFESLGGKK